MSRPLTALLLAALLAGCTAATDEPTGTGSDPCPMADEASHVSGWTAYGGQWGPAASSDVCGEGEAALNSLVKNGLGPFADLEATMTFTMLERDLPEFDAGAGMVIHFLNDQNFQIIRYSAREQGWHLFTMTEGVRTKQGDASVTPPTTNPEFGEPVDLRVTSMGGHVEAYHGTTKVIDYMLPDGASTSGGVGYFLRAEQAAEFSSLNAVAP